MSTPVSAALVKSLRDRTGAGMMECKRALEESQGNLEKAVEILRKSGQAKADKKTGIAAEGAVFARLNSDKTRGILLEINCQTDFVARDSSFLAFAEAVAEKALEENLSDVETLLAQKINAQETIEEARRALVAKIGENIQIRRLKYLTSKHQLVAYLHNGRIGALVDFEGDETVGKDVAIHIVASNPLVVSPSEIPQELLNKEKEVFLAQAMASGKPANIAEKMVEGKMKKFSDEVSLLGQPFVRNPDETVAELLNRSQTKVHGFVRLALGEGIEKETENFAEAVMAQVKGG